MIVIWLAALAMTTVMPLAVSIFVGEAAAKVLVEKTSFFASKRLTVAVDKFDSNTRLLKPVGGVWPGVLLEEPPQPAIARTNIANQNREESHFRCIIY
jgi:hypothetical protein